MNRRRFIKAGLMLVAAPAIVRFDSLMKLPPKRAKQVVAFDGCSSFLRTDNFALDKPIGWQIGDVVYNAAEGAGPIGWICVAGGSLGTWKQINEFSSDSNKVLLT